MQKLTVSRKRGTIMPVGQYVCGHFIEDGFGAQSEGMRAEMLFNRAFKDISKHPYQFFPAINIHKDAYGPHCAFWHSAYEDCDWEVIGGEQGARISRTIGNCSYMGNDAMLVTILQNGGGLTQDRIWLDKSRSYTFSLTAMREGHKYSPPLPGYAIEDLDFSGVPLYVTFTDMDSGKEVYKGEIKLAPTMETNELAIKTPGFTGWARLSLTVGDPANVIFSWASLRPDDHIEGWRPDVVSLLKSLKPAVIRFPGGCFASFFNWREGIRPRESRTPLPSYYWGGMHNNEAGMDDYLRLCEMVGAEPQVLVPMMAGTPFEAYEMVQYLNGDDETHMGKLRKLNGVTRGNKVKFFEMENEAGRKWSALQYAAEFNKFAEMMRKADPDISLMMEVYSYGIKWLPQMLEIAGGQANIIITRAVNKDFLNRYIDVLREYNKKNGTKIRLANTEWLPNASWHEPFEDPEYPQAFDWGVEPQMDDRKNSRSRMIRWFYALNGAKTMMDYISLGGEFILANFNNCCNTWGGNVIESAKEKAWLSPAGYSMGMFPGVDGMWPLEHKLDADETVSAVALADEGEGLQLFLLNLSGDEKSIELDMPPANFVSGESRYANHPLARAQLNSNDIIITSASPENGAINLPKYSLTKLVFTSGKKKSK